MLTQIFLCGTQILQVELDQGGSKLMKTLNRLDIDRYSAYGNSLSPKEIFFGILFFFLQLDNLAYGFKINMTNKIVILYY